MGPQDLNPFLDRLAAEEGFALVGWTPLQRPVHFDFYRQWLQDGHHGKMRYLEDHAPVKANPQARYSVARSAFVFAIPYRPHPAPAVLPLKEARIASYAKGEDYHHWLKNRLLRISKQLQEQWPDHSFECHTDSSPLLERDLAWSAGLGWVGKNTCLIHRRQGSFFLLGEILSSLEFAGEAATPVADFCGTCTRCLDACPTGALISPRTLDARRCISYLSIESRELPPNDLREAWGDWLFGCDICQSVCPWNNKPFHPSESEKQRLLPDSDDQILEEELRWILTSSSKNLEKNFKGTAFQRAGGFGLKRNALVVIGNRRLLGVRNEVQALLEHPKLGELAKWCLEKLN